MANACARPVYPSEVTAFVKKEISSLVSKELESNGESGKQEANKNDNEIPKSLQIQSSVRQSYIKESILVEVDISGQPKTVVETNVLRGIEALTMSVLAELYKQELEGFGLFGIIKETGVDDVGLIEYYSDYFTFPLYRDQSFSFYHALGDRKIGVGVLFNPLSLVTLMCEAWQRIKSKNIEGNLKGEGLIQGGLIVFDPKGKPLLVYQEQTGQDIPVADLVLALRTIRRRQQQSSS